MSKNTKTILFPKPFKVAMINFIFPEQTFFTSFISGKISVYRAAVIIVLMLFVTFMFCSYLGL